ncbi:AraC family transcriptional regulator [Elizabethkingia anophelis]|nr:AraC family transcriptional regulator [Elizabethkingia anophelis]
MAEEAGFSSPNKFATVFKKEVSVSPSLYIKHLDDIESG